MRLKIRHFLLIGISAICSFIFISCSTALLGQRGTYLRAYHAGSLEQAEQNLDCIVQKELPQENYTQSKNASWMLLDRATTRFAQGKTSSAINDYSKALEALDYYDQEIVAERIAQVLLQDETGAYQADDFEQVLARFYFALALLHQGDESNAYAILRQAEEYQELKREAYTKIPFTRHYHLADNGLSKYLFATLLEKRGDRTNAEILYQQALSLITCRDQVDVNPQSRSKQATVLVLCHNGNAPYKVSATSPASVASAVALEILLSSRRRDPAISTLTGIPVPALQRWPLSNPLPTYACLDGLRKPLFPYYNVTKAAEDELNQKLPVIVARGVARLAMRRATVDYFQRQDGNLGALADLTMCVINSNTRADTRSWTTLPAVIDLTRFEVDPGVHTLNLQVYAGPNCLKNQTYQLNLKPNDLCIVHVFNIHPGITKILIPHRFLINQGEFQ